MIETYLEERKNILKDIIRKNSEKYEHNQIAITEANNKIKDLDEIVDEASQIFSVKAREDNGFKNQEINDLESRIAAYVMENSEYEKNINQANEELSIVEQCLNEIYENARIREEFIGEDVSRETSTTKSKINKTDAYQLNFTDILDEFPSEVNKSEIIQKLEFCKNIAEIDAKRVSIELDNIINIIKV